jgi:uncharacterized protein YneF (UPF0154 family)
MTDALLVMIYGQLCYVIGCIAGRYIARQETTRDR